MRGLLLSKRSSFYANKEPLVGDHALLFWRCSKSDRLVFPHGHVRLSILLLQSISGSNPDQEVREGSGGSREDYATIRSEVECSPEKVEGQKGPFQKNASSFG